MKSRFIYFCLIVSFLIVLSSCSGSPSEDLTTGQSVAIECVNDLKERLPGNVDPVLYQDAYIYSFAVSKNVALEKQAFVDRLSKVTEDNIGCVDYFIVTYSVLNDKDFAIYFLKEKEEYDYDWTYLGNNTDYLSAQISCSLDKYSDQDDVSWEMVQFCKTFGDGKYIEKDIYTIDKDFLAEHTGLSTKGDS